MDIVALLDVAVPFFRIFDHFSPWWVQSRCVRHGRSDLFLHVGTCICRHFAAHPRHCAYDRRHEHIKIANQVPQERALRQHAGTRFSPCSAAPAADAEREPAPPIESRVIVIVREQSREASTSTSKVISIQYWNWSEKSGVVFVAECRSQRCLLCCCCVCAFAAQLLRWPCCRRL